MEEISLHETSVRCPGSLHMLFYCKITFILFYFLFLSRSKNYSIKEENISSNAELMLWYSQSPGVGFSKL